MYLSKLYFHTRNRKSFQVLQSPYDLHGALLKAFPSYKKTEKFSGILFRQERKLDGDSRIAVLVQSLMSPNWELLKEDLGNAFQYDQSKKMSNLQFRDGQRLRFRLRANPIKTIRDENGRKNKKGEIKRCRVPLLKENQKIAWLEKKGREIRPGISGGFQIISCRVIDEGDWKHRKVGESDPIRIHTVLFDGVLTVGEPNFFLEEAVKKGIGPAKSFGCGLLSLARA
ncbi:MAG: type I-E CRISPR-associated protein Cas6/Cse3/CasE [Deltaproteobacteria bacterium]|nr:type I-E CRISPR-associated protein Cas6/Cse3/CasE [Deltaproteobacteria bacterium]